MTTITTTTLPDTLSALIRVAVDDARRLDRDAYRPHWSAWHEPLYDADRPQLIGRCEVCLAGCVIAGTLGQDLQEEAEPSDFDYETGYKLFALEDVRQGNLESALDLMSYQKHVVAEKRSALASIPRLRDDEFDDWHSFDAFLDDLGDVADQLEVLGF